MRLKKSLFLAWNILSHSKLRSWLTIIGIIIGIAAVVSIISVSEGAQQALESRFSQFGADIITVSPGVSRAGGGFRGPEEGGGGGSSLTSEQKNLTNRDIVAIKSLPNIKNVMGVVSASGDMAYLGESGSVSIQGVDTTVWKDMINYGLESGRFLTKGDTNSVVLGYERAHSFFKKDIQINRQITIEGRTFKVVGILKEGDNDRGVFMPIDTARTVLADVGSNEFGSISVQMQDMALFEETVASIEKKLMLSRGVLNAKDKDFTVTSQQQVRETITQTLNTMAIFLGAIAAISLIVGAVGISNTMFTAVMEKTKDIGVMKATGAKNWDILVIFLFNSGMIGLAGGIGGVILGSIGSGFISLLVSGTSTTGGGGGIGRALGSTALSPNLLIFAFLFSIVIGMIAGAIPAYRASKLKPVDALRYE